jgi:hypothetical protein
MLEFVWAALVVLLCIAGALFGADSRPVDASSATRWYPGFPP